MRIIITAVIFLAATAAFAQPGLDFHSNVEFKTKEIRSLAFDKDGKLLAAGTDKGIIYILDTESGDTVNTFKYHKKEISCLAFDAEGKYLISGSHDKKIVVWDIGVGDTARVIEDVKAKISSVALSPDGKLLAASGSNKKIFLWQFPSGYLMGSLAGHKGNIVFIAFDRSARQLLSVGKDRKMMFWNLDRMQTDRVTEIKVQTMVNSGIEITSATCSNDRQIIAVGVREQVLDKGAQRMKYERSVAFYDWQAGNQVKVISGNIRDMDKIVLTPQIGYLVSDNSSFNEFRLAFWDTESGVIERSFSVEAGISDFDVSPDGHWFAAAYNDEDARSSFVTLWQAVNLAGIDDAEWAPDILSREITLSDERPLISSGPQRTMAVMYFEYNNVDEPTARSVTTLLESRLVNSPYVRLLERNQIDRILDELKLQASGLTESQVIEIGKLAQAQFMLIGSVDKLASDLHITARLVNVENGSIEGIREVKCSNASLSSISDMVDLLAPAIAATE
jgi:WD40 repeat protein